MWGALSLRDEINLANSNAITKINNVIYMYSMCYHVSHTMVSIRINVIINRKCNDAFPKFNDFSLNKISKNEKESKWKVYLQRKVRYFCENIACHDIQIF